MCLELIRPCQQLHSLHPQSSVVPYTITRYDVSKIVITETFIPKTYMGSPNVVESIDPISRLFRPIQLSQGAWRIRTHSPSLLRRTRFGAWS
jgi:hypothetical protein